MGTRRTRAAPQRGSGPPPLRLRKGGLAEGLGAGRAHTGVAGPVDRGRGGSCGWCRGLCRCSRILSCLPGLPEGAVALGGGGGSARSRRRRGDSSDSSWQWQLVPALCLAALCFKEERMDRGDRGRVCPCEEGVHGQGVDADIDAGVPVPVFPSGFFNWFFSLGPLCPLALSSSALRLFQSSLLLRSHTPLRLVLANKGDYRRVLTGSAPPIIVQYLCHRD